MKWDIDYGYRKYQGFLSSFYPFMKYTAMKPCKRYMRNEPTCHMRNGHPTGNQGPVVQSSLSAISLTILADSIYNFLKFFAEKM